MATRSTFSLPVSRLTTACVPRPPQPTRPAFNRSLEEAPRASARLDVAARNVRRETDLEECIREHDITPHVASAALGGGGPRRPHTAFSPFPTALKYGPSS